MKTRATEKVKVATATKIVQSLTQKKKVKNLLSQIIKIKTMEITMSREGHNQIDQTMKENGQTGQKAMVNLMTKTIDLTSRIATVTAKTKDRKVKRVTNLMKKNGQTCRLTKNLRILIS